MAMVAVTRWRFTTSTPLVSFSRIFSNGLVGSKVLTRLRPRYPDQPFRYLPSLHSSSSVRLTPPCPASFFATFWTLLVYAPWVWQPSGWLYAMVIWITRWNRGCIAAGASG
jgi:hypothetical protein